MLMVRYFIESSLEVEGFFISTQIDIVENLIDKIQT